MQPASHTTVRIHFISLLLAYALIVSLLPPFAIMRAESAEANRGSKEDATTIDNSNRQLSLSSSPQASEQRPGELLVRFRQGVSEHDKAAAVAAQGVRRKRQLRGESGIEKLEVATGQDTETVALQLRLNPTVEFVEPNFLIQRDDLRVDPGARNVARRFTSPHSDLNKASALDYLNPMQPGSMGGSVSQPESSFSNSLTPPQSSGIQPDDTRFNEQWALNNTGQSGGQFGSDIGVTTAWQRTTGARSTVIAVIDSGVDFTHPDLINNRWTNRRERDNNSDDDHNGYVNDLFGWDWITDSGVIRDEQGHGTAMAGIIGAQGNNGTGVAGVMWEAGLMSLRVLNSTGTGDVADAVEAIDYAVAMGANVINCSWGTGGESLLLRDAIERAGRRGVVVVVSAGNGSANIDATPYYPASFDLPNLISVASTDRFDNLAAFSNWGATRVAVAAPGMDILTTKMNGDYWVVSGTSSSTPQVSGIVGLLKTQRSWLSAISTKQAVLNGARRVGTLEGRVLSGGVANASGALASATGPYEPPNGEGNGNGQGGQPPGATNRDRNQGGHTRRVQPPAPVPNDQGGTPNLDAIRNQPSYIPGSVSEPIRSNLAPVCDTCYEAGGAYPNDPEFSKTRSEHSNDTGEPGVDLGSRNFNWSKSLVSLPGRAGLDLNLAIYYNSLVWTKHESSLQFNADNGYPSPGFHLGFPTVQRVFYNPDIASWAFMMITSSGGRVMLKQVSVGSNVYEAIDGSYTQLTLVANGAVVRTSDGTQYTFQDVASGEKRCNQIKDRNGNYITISYNGAGRISAVTDTLGRVVNFGYDGEGNLYELTQSRASSGHTDLLVRFGYGTQYVQPSVPVGTSVYGPNGEYISVLTQIIFPDNSKYTFDYTVWGQVYKISHLAPAPAGHVLSYTGYNLPGSAWLGNSTQSDCPRFTERRDWIEYGVMQANAEVITKYAVAGDGSWSQVTLPDDTPTNPNDNVVQKEYFATSGWRKGLTTRTEVFLFGTPTVLKKWTTTDWTQDGGESLTYQKNPRPTEINIYDESGNRRRTTLEYNPTYEVFSLPWHIVEYGSDGVTAVRRTRFDYKMEAAYIDRRVIGLLYQKQVFDGAWNLFAKESYGYDWAGELFVDTPASATQHDRINYGPGFVTGRGNLQHIIRADHFDPNNSGKWQETKFRYNSTGSMLLKRDHNWHETAYDYTDSFSDLVNRNTFAYATRVTDAEGYQATTKFNYATGAVTETRRPSSGTTSQGNITYEQHTMIFDWLARPQKIQNDNNSFYTRFEYPDDLSHTRSYSNIKFSPAEAYSVEVYDGIGRVRKRASFMPDKTDRYSATMLHYDSLGRVVKQSKPTEILGDWTPTGPDDAGNWIYTDQAYDWQGRPTITTQPDGWTSELSYAGCGCAGGGVVTARDEAGRRRKVYKDTLGRLWKVEELDWNQVVYSTTTYDFNVRDQITQVTQQGQVRTMQYDGHGRLWKRTTPEQGQTEYSYNTDDTVSWVKDARGVKTVFVHSNRHLVTSVSYDLSGVVPGQNVTATPQTTFEYNAAGNRKKMTDGLGTVDYHYDSLSRMDWEERTFSGGVGTYRLTYGYDNAGLLSITNPWGSKIWYTRDHTATLMSVSGEGPVSHGNYASGIQYRAFGAVKAMNYGNTRQLSVSYDSRMRPMQWNVAGLLGSEYRYDYFHEHTGRVTFARNLYNSLLDYSYEYDYVGRLSIAHSGTEARAHVGIPGAPWGILDGPFSQGYEYDRWGNMTRRYGWGGVLGGAPGSNNQQINTFTNNQRVGFTYDLAGNLTNDLGQTFTYDATGQQTNASYSGYSLGQGYDGDTLRVKKVENGTTLYYLRSTVLGGQVAAEIGNSGGSWIWWRGYVYLGNQLLAVQQDGVVRWVHEDPVTKAKVMTNSGGAPISTINFDPWGGDAGGGWSQNAWQQRRRFTTYERDGNESDEAMMRRYNRWHARFDQPDPYEGSYSLSDPQSFNRYAYVHNDPVNFVDPRGLSAQAPNWLYDAWAMFNAGCSNLSGDGGRAIICNGVGGPNGSISFGGGWRGPSLADLDEGGGSDYERSLQLTQCVKDLLAKFFDRNLLDAIRVHRNSPIVPPTMSAMTLGDNIHFKKDEFNVRTLDGITLLAHEIAHSVQYRMVGAENFLKTYALSSALVIYNPVGLAASAIAATKGINLPHEMNAYEKAANAKARDVRTHLDKLGYGGEGLYCHN